MAWSWGENKNQSNKRKHGVRFQTAVIVFDDPFAVSRLDDEIVEERWQTVGLMGTELVFVVHTWPDEESGRPGRIITARKASPHERRAYKKGSF